MMVELASDDELVRLLEQGSGTPAVTGSGGEPRRAEADLSAWGVVTQAAANFPESLAQLGSDIVQPFLDPVKTATSLYQLGSGIYQLAVPGEHPNEEVARRVGQYFAERYGGLENIKRTIAADPAGFLADLSLLASGGIGAVAKAGKVAGVAGAATKVGERAGRAAQLLDPTIALAAGVTKGGGAVLSGGLGTLSGVGSRAVQTAFGAGLTGGEKAKAFLSQLRGKRPITDLVDAAKEALGSLKSERQVAYTARMEKLGQDATPLGFGEIDDVLADMATEGKFKEIPIRGSKPAKTLEEIAEIIENFRGRDPSEYHTAIAFDSMKKAIGEVRDAINIADNPAAWNLANKVYGSVRRTIVNQDPSYAKAMKEYEEATDLIIDIEKTFNLPSNRGRRSAVDTQVRKLASIMNDNVNTAYGRRVELAERLSDARGGGTLMDLAAGAQLAPLRGRGLANVSSAAILAGGATVNPWLLAAYPATVPRVVGEAAYAAGRTAPSLGAALRGAQAAAPISYQVGRTSRQTEPTREELMIRALQGN
jgi:hypothetical protein